jgi:hypothetical protein
MPQIGCGGNVYAKWRWEPKTYFAVRDARWKATVSVGSIAGTDPSDKVGSKAADAKPTAGEKADSQH